MTTLGYQLFAKTPEWLAQHYARGFGHAILAILRKNPDLTDLDVGNRMMDYYEPELLTIEDPLETSMSWGTERVTSRAGAVDDMYLHEARLRFSGTRELWRLVGRESYRFTTRVSFTVKYARLRAFRPDRDVDAFREAVLTDIGQARRHATEQDGAIAWFRTHLHGAVEHCYGNEDFGALRAHARDLKDKDDRMTAHLRDG